MKSLVSTKPVNLRQLLHQHITRVDDERHPYLLHASAVTVQDPASAFCPREAVLRKQLNTPAAKEEVRTCMAVTWAWGHRTEDAVREWFSEMGRTVGDWKCNHKPCGEHYRWQKRPPVCSKCGGVAFQYRERRAWSAITGITCSVDIFLNTGRPKLQLVEVKSIDKDKFADLKGPLAEHSLRTKLYLRQMAECEDPDLRDRVDHQSAFVLYVSKGGYGVVTPEMEHWPFYDSKFSPFKPYEITRNDEDTEPYTSKARAAHEAMNMGGPMPARICPVVTNKRAQNCPVAGPCFKMGN